jgi:hypothetical protein
MRRPLIGAKGFQSFHWTRGTSSRKVMEAYQAKRHWVYGKKEKKKEENEVRERLLVLVCGGVHGKVMKKLKYGMELCVASHRSEASGLWFN